MVNTPTYIMKLIVDIDDELNKEFRDTILRVKGWNKGVIKDALKEAIELWISANAKSKK